MSEEMPELPEAHRENSALAISVGAAHYWKRKHDKASKHRLRVFGVGIVVGIILAQLGPTVATWARAAF